MKIWEAYEKVIAHPNFSKISLAKLKEENKILALYLINRATQSKLESSEKCVAVLKDQVGHHE